MVDAVHARAHTRTRAAGVAASAGFTVQNEAGAREDGPEDEQALARLGAAGLSAEELERQLQAAEREEQVELCVFLPDLSPSFSSPDVSSPVLVFALRSQVAGCPKARRGAGTFTCRRGSSG
jgi:hypothetical protein